jgi:hypothetical protein
MWIPTTRRPVSGSVRICGCRRCSPPAGEASLGLELLGTYAATADLPLALATGQAWDVYLCHPFLVYAAQPNRHGRPRFVAQPPLILREPCVLDRVDGACSPVEQAIRRGLGLPDRLTNSL